MSDRLLPFEAIENFRDFGGYATPSGTVRRGVLYRSGQLARATDADIARLGDLGLGHVVDLRRSSERAKQPDRLPQGWAGRMVTTDLGGEGEAPHIQFLKTQPLTEDSGRRYMGQTYERMPFEPSHVALFRDYFDALASSNEAVLATNAAVDLEGRAEEFGRALQKWTGKPVSHGAVVAFLGVEPDFLHRAIKAMEHQHGSLEGYLAAVLGVDTAKRDAIISRLNR